MANVTQMKRQGSETFPQMEGTTEPIDAVPAYSCQRLVRAKRVKEESLDTPFVGITSFRQEAQNARACIHSRWTIETLESASGLQREVLDLLGRVQLPRHHRWAVAISAAEVVQGIVASGGKATVLVSVVGNPAKEAGFEIFGSGNLACYQFLKTAVTTGSIAKLMDAVEFSGHAPELHLSAKKFLRVRTSLKPRALSRFPRAH